MEEKTDKKPKITSVKTLLSESLKREERLRAKVIICVAVIGVLVAVLFAVVCYWIVKY